jgi:hypothetical protein
LTYGRHKQESQREEEREDLLWGQLYLGSIPKIPSRQPLAYIKGVGEDELDGDNETLSDYTDNNNLKNINQLM